MAQQTRGSNIQAIDSPAYLYYIGLKKVKTAGQLGTTSWTAKRLDNSTKANATWSGSFNDDAEYITLSAFAEKLTLTFPNITEVPFNMRLLGDEFRIFTPDGLVTELTGLENTDTLTIVPTNGGVLEHLDKIQLYGESNNYFYKQDITLKLRPYVKLTHNLGTFETVQIDGETNAQLSVGKEVTFTFTYMDNSIVTETAQFRLSEWRDNSDVQNDFFTATSPAGWNKGDFYTLSSPKVGDVQTFNLKATKAGGTVFQARGTASCDVYSGDTLKGSFFPTGKLDNIYPKIHITGVSITYDWGTYTDAEGQLPKDSVTGSGAEYTLPAKNFTLYKEGYTLKGWNDGTTTHALGAILGNITSNVTLTPVFEQNTVSLDDRTEPVTITWDFQRDNGAPTINGWEGTDGHVWVAQATVTNGSTTGIIDVKMDVNTTSGKFANASWGDWCQLNNGTILTIPSCTGATVEMNAYDEISTTTIDGSTEYDSGYGTTKIQETVTSTADDIDVVIGDGSYYKYLTVTLPVVTYAHTVTYYNDGYPSTGVYTTQGYKENATLTLPSSNPSVTNREFSHWVTVTDDGSGKHGTRTEIEGGESVSADMHIYPVYTAIIGATANTIRPGDIIQVSGCYTKNTDQIIDSSRNGHYVLFKVKPQTTGWYSFTSAIGTKNDGVSVTLGYVNGDTYVESEQIGIENTKSFTTTKNYTWGFYLNANTTYTFKMRCNKSDDNYCVNAYTMTVQQMNVTGTTNVIPTTSAYPFTLTNGTLTAGSQANFANGDHIDYMYGGNYVTYNILNAKNTKYQIGFSAATTQASITVTFSLTNSSGTVVWSGESSTITPSGDNSWDKYNSYPIEVDEIIPTGIYTLKIVFNDNDSNSGNGTTCNLKNITFTAKE